MPVAPRTGTCKMVNDDVTLDLYAGYFIVYISATSILLGSNQTEFKSISISS